VFADSSQNLGPAVPIALGGERGKAFAGQLIMAPPYHATEGVVGRSDHDVFVIRSALFQDHDKVVRLVQRVVKHTLERCRLEQTMPHSGGP
jgi:hypothetical protein